ncbi:MAG: hypothetical protein KF744_03585 [Taibaiella sp.]|nr:hypothetical protein [Taibaiella sp.]
MTWKRFLIATVSLLLAAGAVKFVIACAGDDPDPQEEPTFFFNTITSEPVYTPFFYTPDFTFLTDCYGLDSSWYNYYLSDVNIASWKKITGGSVREAEIDSFVYKFSAADMLNVFEHIKKGYSLTISPRVSKNAFTNWLIKNKQAEIPLYLSFAKKCEPHAMATEAYWDDNKNDYARVKRDSAAMQQLVHDGINLYKETSNAELKLRYAYQVMRMAFYSGEYPQTLMLFNTLLPQHSTHFLYYRCLSLKAGALYRTGKKSEAAYLYSHVFDSSDELKTQAYQGFRWSVDGNLSNVLIYCKNDHERAVLYVMRGMYDYGARYYYKTPAEEEAGAKAEIDNMYSTISTAYAYDSKVYGLEVLMTRYINKLERSRIPALARHNAGNISVNKLIDFSSKVAAEGNRSSVAYWHLASAYLYMLDGDWAAAGKKLELAKGKKKTIAEENGYYTLSTLYALRRNGTITKLTEEELLPNMKDLEQKAAENPVQRTLFSTVTESVMEPMYLQQGDTIRALLAFAKSRSVHGIRDMSYFAAGFGSNAGSILEGMSIKKMHEMQAFMQQKEKTPFDEWLIAGNSTYSAENLFELEGTRHMENLQFGQAAIALKKVPEIMLNRTLLPDMFVSHLTDKMGWNRSDSAVTYNKLSFALRMYELQRKLTEDPTDVRSAYQYANGLYSMSYYGKGWQAGEYYRSGGDYAAYYRSDARRNSGTQLQQYYGIAMAEKYYQKAFENATDPEMKARCVFLAAKCRQKSCPVNTHEKYFMGDEKAYYQYSLESPYFKQLQEDYNTTIFYKQVVGSCSYLQDYLETHK